MPAISYRDLNRRYQLDGAQKTVRHLSEAIREKHLAAEDFSIRDLAEALVPDGREWVARMNPRSRSSILVAEAEGVDVTAFANITGQLIFSKIHDAYMAEDFHASKVVQHIPTRLDGEKIPGVARIDPDAMEDGIDPGMPYPNIGFGERYTETPSTTKRGAIVPVHRETIFFDRTHLVISRAAEVGDALGANKEKRILDVLIGATNNYNQNGSSLNTYQTATPWINEQSGVELIDWTDVDAAEQLLADMLDPDTSEPIRVHAKHVMVPPAKKHAANRIFGAAVIRYTASGAATETEAPNPMQAAYSVMASAQMYRRIIATGETASNAADWWFLGDFTKAFGYMENWGLTVTQAPFNSEAEFTNDVVLRWKASERGVAVVLDPRFVVKNYQA